MWSSAGVVLVIRSSAFLRINSVFDWFQFADSFPRLAEGLQNLADSFPRTSVGLRNLADSFPRTSEGLRNPADSFPQTSEGLRNLADSFPRTSEGLRNLADSFPRTSVGLRRLAESCRQAFFALLPDAPKAVGRLFLLYCPMRSSFGRPEAERVEAPPMLRPITSMRQRKGASSFVSNTKRSPAPSEPFSLFSR